MEKDSLYTLGVAEVRSGVVGGAFSAREITDGYLRRINEHDASIGAYLMTLPETARHMADEADAAVALGEAGPLAGVPFAVKDNILIEGARATAGSRVLKSYTASYDATVIKKLREAGAVFLGKTNLDEFAMGSSTENSGFQVTRNPHDTSRVPGGSSGGSAAAVASGMAAAALGSDTGGSIRQPAAFCGVAGLKPTYGAVSRHGLMSLASSLDQIGPLGKTVADVAAVFSVIAGRDVYDSTSAAPAHGYGDELSHLDGVGLRELVVGIPKEYFVHNLEPEVQKGVEQAMEDLKRLGIAFKEVSLPHTKYALSCYYIVLPAEASSNLARYDGIRYGERGAGALRDAYIDAKSRGFGAEVKRRILLGTFSLSSGYYDAYYTKAGKVRALIERDFAEAFKTVDVLFTPVTPSRAFKIGEKINDPLQMYLSDIFTIPVNLAGLPALTVPVRGIEGLPVGFQLIGKAFREADILGLGRLYEEA